MAQRGLTRRQASRVKKRRAAGIIDLLKPRVVRLSWHLRSETRSRYDALVATGEVDRAEWAVVISDLLASEAGIRKHGAKTRFADKAGVSVRTVDTWLRQEVGVKESSVRAVAEAYELDLMQLLIRVGFYAQTQMPYQPTDEEIDEEQRAVLDRDDLDDRTKAEILKQLDEMRADDERLLLEQRQRDKQRRMREIAWRIEQARRSA